MRCNKCNGQDLLDNRVWLISKVTSTFATWRSLIEKAAATPEIAKP